MIMDGLEFTEMVADVWIYSASQQLPACPLYALMFNVQGSAPAKLSLADIWNRTAQSCCLIFIDTPIRDRDASAAYTAMKAALSPAPTWCDIGWFNWSASGPTLAVRLRVEEAKDFTRVVAADTPLRALPGLPAVVAPKGAPVSLLQGPSVVVGSAAAIQPSAAPGISIPLAGPLAGAPTFQGLSGMAPDWPLALTANVVDILKPVGGRSTQTLLGPVYKVVSRPEGAYLEHCS